MKGCRGLWLLITGKDHRDRDYDKNRDDFPNET
jgi:hypothetical protein